MKKSLAHGGVFYYSISPRHGVKLPKNMDNAWNDSQPIYRQLRDLVVSRIIDGTLEEEDALPSVRNVAAEYRINPLTVMKAYQELVQEDLVDTRRGLGMFVKPGARKVLLRHERQRFLEEEWPSVLATIHRLGFTPEELIKRDASRRVSVPLARAR
jgi:GntR family transcriptional regulator